MVGAMPPRSIKTRESGAESISELVGDAENVGTSGSACGKEMIDPLPDNLCGNDSQSCSDNSVRPLFAITERMKPSEQWMCPVSLALHGVFTRNHEPSYTLSSYDRPFSSAVRLFHQDKLKFVWG